MPRKRGHSFHSSNINFKYELHKYPKIIIIQICDNFQNEFQDGRDICGFPKGNGLKRGYEKMLLWV